MFISIFVVLWLFWFGWFLHYGIEASSLIWCALLCWWTYHIDMSYSSSLFLFLSILTLLIAVHYNDSWLSWSEYNYMLAIFLLFLLTTSSFWVHDAIMLIMVIDMLHLIVILLILNDVSLSRILLFLMSGWVFNILILLAMGYNYIYLGDVDLYRMLWSSTSGLMTGHSDILYLLILGKLYIIPWTLILIIIYSTIRLDVLMVVTMLFTIHFTIMLVTVLSDVVSTGTVYNIIMVVTASLLLTTILFTDVNDLNVFLGLSFSIIVHISVILTLITGTHIEDINLLLISVYILLSIVFLSCLYMLETNSYLFDAFDSVNGINYTLGVSLVITLMMMLGIPPSLVFILKNDFLMNTWLYLSYAYGLILFLTVTAGTVYVRLLFRVCMSVTSSTDMHHISGTATYIISCSLLLILTYITGLL